MLKSCLLLAVLLTVALAAAMSAAERHPGARFTSAGRSSWRRTAWSPPAIRWRRRSGSTCCKSGGNAIDAAIAANAALGLMEPMRCGIGGDLFAIVWDAKTQKLYGLNASGRSPYKAPRELLRRARGSRRFPTTGPLSWSVPGCVDGWDELRKQLRHAAARPSCWSRASATPRKASPSPR